MGVRSMQEDIRRIRRILRGMYDSLICTGFPPAVSQEDLEWLMKEEMHEQNKDRMV